MSVRNTPRTPSRTEQREASPDTGDQALQAAEGLGRVLSEITNRTRRELSRSPLEGGGAGQENSPNPLYGVNMQRGSTVANQTGWEDVNVQMFEPRRGEVTAAMVDGEISRMLNEHRGQRAPDWNVENSVLGTVGEEGDIIPFRPALRATRKTLFAGLRPVNEEDRDSIQGLDEQSAPEDATTRRFTRIEQQLRDMEQRLSQGQAKATKSSPVGAIQEDSVVERLLALEETVRDFVLEGRKEKQGDATPPRQRSPYRRQTRTLAQAEEGRVYMDVPSALRNVKTFDGNDPTKLEGFMHSCEAVWGMVHPAQRSDLLALIRSSKLEDRATREMRHKTTITLGDLRKELEALYGKRESLASLQYQFCTLRQDAHENVSTYATRVETLTVEVIEKLCEGIDSRGARYIGEATRKSAQMNFENGLKQEIQTIVRSRNYQSLHDSVVGAIEVEKMTTRHQDMHSSDGGSPQQSPATTEGGRICFMCGNPGHLAKDCRQPNRQSLPVPEQRDVSLVNATCHFCKKFGHLMKDCRARKRAEEKKNKNMGQQAAKTEETSAQPAQEGTVGAFRINTVTANRIAEENIGTEGNPPWYKWTA